MQTLGLSLFPLLWLLRLGLSFRFLFCPFLFLLRLPLLSFSLGSQALTEFLLVVGPEGVVFVLEEIELAVA